MSPVLTSYQLRLFGEQLAVAEFAPWERERALAQADYIMSTSDTRSVEVSAAYHQDSCDLAANHCDCKRQLVWLVTRQDYDQRRLAGAFPLFPQGPPRRVRPSGLADRLIDRLVGV